MGAGLGLPLSRKLRVAFGFEGSKSGDRREALGFLSEGSRAGVSVFSPCHAPACGACGQTLSSLFG